MTSSPKMWLVVASILWCSAKGYRGARGSPMAKCMLGEITSLARRVEEAQQSVRLMLSTRQGWSTLRLTIDPALSRLIVEQNTQHSLMTLVDFFSVVQTTSANLGLDPSLRKQHQLMSIASRRRSPRLLVVPSTQLLSPTRARSG